MLNAVVPAKAGTHSHRCGVWVPAFAGTTLALFLGILTPALGQEIFSVYSSFDADKTCKHRPGRDVEDYGSWVCPGQAGLIVYLTAGDQRMQVSFGRDARAAAKEEAASQTFPGFNSVYRGTVEWRMERDDADELRLPVAPVREGR